MTSGRAQPRGAGKAATKRRHARGDRIVALFLLGVIAFNAPVLFAFDVARFVFGIPVLYVYLFAAWAGLLILMALSARTARDDSLGPPPPGYAPRRRS